ncbi:unnamed protein product, partial [Haemonchus placei]|uniref:Set apart in position or space protein n=1 Tax=Haemonchus placei TaxID=6290 RepID=A0A0N4WP83_HAEPC
LYKCTTIVNSRLSVCWSITASDVYKRLLERERNVEDTFAFNFVRPIGSVAGELIWPRSYDSSNELTFDENGAAFPLHERPTLSKILRLVCNCGNRYDHRDLTSTELPLELPKAFHAQKTTFCESADFKRLISLSRRE